MSPLTSLVSQAVTRARKGLTKASVLQSNVHGAAEAWQRYELALEAAEKAIISEANALKDAAKASEKAAERYSMPRLLFHAQAANEVAKAASKAAYNARRDVVAARRDIGSYPDVSQDFFSALANSNFVTFLFVLCKVVETAFEVCHGHMIQLCGALLRIPNDCAHECSLGAAA